MMMKYENNLKTTTHNVGRMGLEKEIDLPGVFRTSGSERISRRRLVKGGVKVYRRGGKCPTWCVKKGAHGPPSWVVASLHWDGVLRLCLFV